MAAIDETFFLDGPPCVVIDRVKMTYKVESSDERSGAARGLKGRLRKALGRPSRVTVTALKELSLVVERGESVGIIGRNGSGKSTMMKLISGQTAPTEGGVYASSTPILLGVNAALVPELSGDQNVVLGCLAMGMSMEQIDEQFDSIVELSGLESAIYLPMKSYSSGMASRLRFAIAAAVNPEILLVDEALNTGDAQFSSRSKARMDELRAQAGCVFIVSHSLETIRDMCTRVIWLDKGELIMDGSPEETTDRYRDFSAHLSKGNNISATRIKDDARANLVATQVLERTSGRRMQGR
ncbi:teichoic acid transport system ATP-binding protein [Pseudarthrobacter enclensis]|uniref:Polysaccharide/polyol phosphate ABC transporter ATP-binding protein n=1 Tax=Pseudarthrobacter enclensis TaxID=993070 RepID=A0A0V8IV56_9MICC|nr:ATP-binding cassette domain-containing protein [Pseudarthrobacter enclensis]KSU78675.1 polysaccharide/polyol phosphate ABC transporter ATP-binding protein [Pseudarthrobacter enclensis]SCB75038.1 teichoic acid transport system ATP-binding protein [Pseudarthrobacter enclensis]